MAEAKHKYFLVQNVINKTVSPSNNTDIFCSSNDYSLALRYSGRYRNFHDVSGLEDVSSTSSGTKKLFNFQLIFGPDEILPDNQGTKSDQFVGNKFNWKNTVFSMQYDPTSYLSFIKRIQGQSYGQVLAPRTVESYSAPSHIEDVDLNVYENRSADNQVKSGIFNDLSNPVEIKWKTPTYQTGNEAITGSIRSGIAFTPKGIVVPAITQTPTSSYRESVINVNPTTNNAGYKIVSTANAPVNYFPLLMNPQFKFYYYTRIMVFKFKLPMANFKEMYHNWEQQMNFLNHLWWQRNANQANPNYSIRSSVLNDTNPYGGTFQIVYNKLIKINPAKRYIFRFNFGSRKRKGDLITLKTGDPFNPVPAELGLTDHMYSNACYLGFMLPPIHPDDFDWFGATCIEENSPFAPYKLNTRHKMNSLQYPAEVGDTETWDGPYVPIYDQNNVYSGHNSGQTLNLGSIYLSGRTCFID